MVEVNTKLNKEKREGLIEILKINHQFSIQIGIAFLLITITSYITLVNTTIILFPSKLNIIFIILLLLFCFFIYITLRQISDTTKISKNLTRFMKDKYKFSEEDLKVIR